MCMNFDINSLIEKTPVSTESFFDPAKFIEPLMPYIITLICIAAAIVVLYFINVINTWRSHRATIEMRNILREMNEREKARSAQSSSSDVL